MLIVSGHGLSPFSSTFTLVFIEFDSVLRLSFPSSLYPASRLQTEAYEQFHYKSGVLVFQLASPEQVEREKQEQQALMRGKAALAAAVGASSISAASSSSSAAPAFADTATIAQISAEMEAEDAASTRLRSS